MKISTKGHGVADAITMLESMILVESVYAYYLNGVLSVLLLRLFMQAVISVVGGSVLSGLRSGWPCFAFLFVLCELPLLGCLRSGEAPGDDGAATDTRSFAITNFMRHDNAYSCTQIFFVDVLIIGMQLSLLAAWGAQSNIDGGSGSWAFTQPEHVQRGLQRQRLV